MKKTDLPGSFAVSNDMLKDIGATGVLKGILPRSVKPTGYLLVEDEDLRPRNLVSMRIFYEFNAGCIVVTDYTHMLKDAIEYHIKLNKHAKPIGVTIGTGTYNQETKKLSARVEFAFNHSGFLHDALGI